MAKNIVTPVENKSSPEDVQILAFALVKDFLSNPPGQRGTILTGKQPISGQIENHDDWQSFSISPAKIPYEAINFSSNELKNEASNEFEHLLNLHPELSNKNSTSQLYGCNKAPYVCKLPNDETVELEHVVVKVKKPMSIKPPESSKNRISEYKSLSKEDAPIIIAEDNEGAFQGQVDVDSVSAKIEGANSPELGDVYISGEIIGGTKIEGNGTLKFIDSKDFDISLNGRGDFALGQANAKFGIEDYTLRAEAEIALLSASAEASFTFELFGYTYDVGVGAKGNILGVGAGLNISRKRIKLSLTWLVGGNVYINLPTQKPTGTE